MCACVRAASAWWSLWSPALCIYSEFQLAAHEVFWAGAARQPDLASRVFRPGPPLTAAVRLRAAREHLHPEGAPLPLLPTSRPCPWPDGRAVWQANEQQCRLSVNRAAGPPGDVLAGLGKEGVPREVPVAVNTAAL